MAFVLITCALGKEDSVLSNLEKLSNIKEVSRVHGAYDVIAKVEASSAEQIKGVITDEIRTINDVRSTINLPLKFYN